MKSSLLSQVVISFLLILMSLKLNVLSQSYIGKYDQVIEHPISKIQPFIQLNKDYTFFMYQIHRKLTGGYVSIINGQYTVNGDTVILNSNIKPKQDASALSYNESYNPFSDSIEINVYYNTNQSMYLPYLVTRVLVNDSCSIGAGNVLHYLKSFKIKMPIQRVYSIWPMTMDYVYPKILIKNINSNVINININFEKLDRQNLALGSFSITDEKYLLRNDTLSWIGKKCGVGDSFRIKYKRNKCMSRKQLKQFKKRVIKNEKNYYLP